MATITAANSVFLLTIPGLFPVPQLLAGYQADDAFSSDAAEVSENIIGVDGRKSAGWLPTLTDMTISLMPDSPSDGIFDAWDQAQRAIREIYFASAVIVLPSVGYSYLLTEGTLKSIQRVVTAKKTLQGRPFIINWGEITKAPIA
jgi:hypothetical protein